METAFVALVACVMAFLARYLYREVREGVLERRLATYSPRLARNDAMLWSAVFGDVTVARTDNAADGDPVLAADLDALSRSIEAAFASGTLSLPKALRVSVVAVDPADGAGEDWGLRRVSLVDAAGHRHSLEMRVLLSYGQHDAAGVPETPWLRESPGTPLRVRVNGIELAGQGERDTRRALAALRGTECVFPWDTSPLA